ncbi:MAG TPA: acetyl-CoA decarbonylase/synthase complex subunit alpha/beta [Planctomycetota bacterium]|nr:acetyl-CoA decarbonylase/synthase complex subunit alpha/beta [Planctomycetota bacterium]
MSRIIATAAINGAYTLVEKAEQALEVALGSHPESAAVELPNTGYYLPIIYGTTGEEVKTLADCRRVLQSARGLLPPRVKGEHWVPYLGHTLDAGMATLWAEEVYEALKYLDPATCPYTRTPAPTDGNLWLGAADDVIMRERGIEFVDGTAPGFAAIVGAAPDSKTAVNIARELQENNLYVFMCAESGGKRFAEQLAEENVQMGWETRLVPFGQEISAAVFALGFAARAALSFGGVQPGDFRRMLLYNKYRVFAFVLALGPVDDEKYATAAGAINYGFPVIADTDIPPILPTGVCLYEHVVPNVKHDEMVKRALIIRGLKVVPSSVDIPVRFGPAFEGERIRKEDMQIEAGNPKVDLPSFEYARTLPTDKVEDGKITVVGNEVDGFKEGECISLGILVEVSGAKMQHDFEPILERQIHTFLNCAQGLFHMGQRDSNWMRFSKEAFAAGLRLKHIGTILHAKLREEYAAIVDKCQVTIFTEQPEVERVMAEARAAYAERDARMAGMTDESVDIFYSCSLCQSFAPNHICIITPEHPGLCGAYNWLDGRAAYEIVPTGPNQPVPKANPTDERLGQWESINQFVFEKSNQKLERFSAYSMMVDPMTSCGCFECISAILPMTNGIMIVDRDHPDMTPCGMKFSTLAGSVGGGNQTPGFLGHSKMYISSKKFISADGGCKRITWMPKRLKDTIREKLNARGAEEGIENFVDLIADETVATTEEQVMEHMQKVGHPAVTMDPMF